MTQIPMLQYPRIHYPFKMKQSSLVISSLIVYHLSLFIIKVGWHLHGKVEYGDSINDEWMVVALLKYITRLVSILSEGDGH